MKEKITLFGVFAAFFFAPIFVDAYVYPYGSGCANVGIWDPETSTCTLTRDINDTVIIQMPGMTLNGAGHAISSPGPFSEYGVKVYQVSGVTIKNITIFGFFTGIYFDEGSDYGAVEKSSINSDYGVRVFHSHHVSVSDSVISATLDGITFGEADNGTAVGNTISAITNGNAGISITSSNGLFAEGNTIDLFSDGFYSRYSSNIIFRNNTVHSEYNGIQLEDSGDSVFEDNRLSSLDAAVSLKNIETVGNIFSKNIIQDSMTGVSANIIYNSPPGGPFLSFFRSFFSPLFPRAALADGDDDNIFFNNDFLNNEIDVSASSIEFIRFYRTFPDGGNFWDKNADCTDGNADGFCDAPYEIDEELALSDDLPRVHKAGYVLPLKISTVSETEDDGLPDAKGVADKTVFTFCATTEGDPETVSFVSDGTADILSKDTLCTTKTFPKGEHKWHFEASKNGTTVKTEEKKVTTGYSNVAFLPGLEASRLYYNTVPNGEGGMIVRMWEPEILHDNSKLFLNSAGVPIFPNIYTKDVISEAYFANIYKTFIGSMNDLVSAETIRGWKPLPYDWRYDIDDIVNNPIQIEGGSYSMTDEILSLAANSDTGKVIIIGHSNGGLIGKVLINKLAEQGRSSITEKFIMVASPQLGTPQAISSLLHGDAIPSDMLPILMAKQTARTLGENMPSGYNLLPSTEYFNRVLDPVAVFDGTTPLTQAYFQKYGSIISNPTELRDFFMGADGRMKPTTNDTYTPNILNSALLSQAEQNHVLLDSWVPPVGVEVIQIAGWGIDTISGINYKQALDCNAAGCITVLDHEPIMTEDGDGTVVVPSAVAMGGVRTYWVNLPDFNKESFITSGKWFNKQHKDILEVRGLLLKIRDIIENISKPEDSIYDTKPSKDHAKKLRLKVHSPVSLNLYDTFGNHTGVSTTTTEGDIRFIDNQVPNSYYLEMGEGKYAGMEASGTTTIKLIGEATGTFTLDIEEFQGGTLFATTTFADIPVTASSTAIVETTALSDGLPVLKLDINGDGTTDATVDPGSGISTDNLVGVMKGMVKTLNLPEKKEQKLLKNIDKLEKVLNKEYKNEKKEKRKTAKAFEEMEKTITKFQKKNLLTKDEADELINILGQVKNLVVK